MVQKLPKILVGDIDNSEFNVANKLTKLDANAYLRLAQIIGNVPSINANGKLILTGSDQIGTKAADLAALWDKTTKIVTGDIDSDEFNVANKLVKLDENEKTPIAQYLSVYRASQPLNSKGNSFPTIQAAIDDMDVAGWVYVPPGTYTEAVDING